MERNEEKIGTERWKLCTAKHGNKDNCPTAKTLLSSIGQMKTGVPDNSP